MGLDTLIGDLGNDSYHIDSNDGIDYGSSIGGDQLTIQNQDSNTIEKFQLDNGQYLTDSDINQIIQDMTTYATDNGISLTSINDVKNNQDLLNVVINSWHS